MDLPGSPRSEVPPAGPVPQAARLAVTAIFAVNGLILSNWVPRIPAVQRNLDLSEGRLGLALLGVAVGALLAMPLIGGLVARFGSRPATTVAVVALAATVRSPPSPVDWERSPSRWSCLVPPTAPSTWR